MKPGTDNITYRLLRLFYQVATTHLTSHLPVSSVSSVSSVSTVSIPGLVGSKHGLWRGSNDDIWFGRFFPIRTILAPLGSRALAGSVSIGDR